MKSKVILLVLLVLPYLSFSKSDTTITHFRKGNYTIQFPNSWKLDTSKIMGTEFFIFSPLENENDKFRENINGFIQNLKGLNINLEKYKDITEKQVKTLFTESKIIESNIIKNRSKEYYKTIYEMQQGVFNLKITSLCIIKNEMAYLITFSSESNKYEKFKTVGEQILNSFTFTN